MSKQAKRVGSSRGTLERTHRIHQLLQNQEYPNCTKMAREFEVSRRTLKRDIEFMKDRLDLPIGFDVQRNGYFYTEKVDRFPELPMSEAEVFSLFVASKAIEQYRGTPFQRLLETAFRRLTGRLDENVKFSVGSLDNVISFRPFAPGDADVRAFETLARAVRERRAVKFMYRNHGALSFQRRHVQPYHLAHVDGRWCLFGFDVDRQAMRTFVLLRLKEPELTAKRFALSKKFDLNEYLAKSFSLFRGKDGDDYEVVIDLDAWAADEVRGRRWHESQEFTELPKGMLRVSMRLSNIEEVEKWVMGFGTHATVVRPKALAERLRKTGEEFATRYRETSEAWPLELAVQLFGGGPVDWSRAIGIGELAGGSAAAGNVLGTSTTLVLVRTETGYSASAAAAEVLGIRSASHLANLTGATVGGGATAILFAYGGYWLGYYDFQTANRSAVAGVAGAGAGVAASAVSLGLISTYATASTGVAISSLSGASATSATVAWLGGGSVASGGLGMTGGAVVLGTGVGVVVIGVTAAVIYGYHLADEHHESVRLTKTIEHLSTKHTFFVPDSRSNVAR